MRTIDMDRTRLNALVVVAWYLRGPCRGGCWCSIKSHLARMLMKHGSPQHGCLGFIDVRPRGPKARRIIRSTKVLPGVEARYCLVLFIEVGLVARGGAYPYGGVTIQTAYLSE
jgi:hypothetical protein